MSGLLLARPRLDARLHASAQGRLTLLLAGAGYGKTTLLRSWTSDVPTAWHTVGPADQAPGALARHIVDALRLRVPDLSMELLIAASRSRGPDADEAARAEAYAAGLAEALEGVLRRRVVLVLDDVHEINDAVEPSRLIAELARQAPARLHLVIASREQMPFRTARMLAHGEATELAAGELTFTAGETAELVASVIGSADPHIADSIYAVAAGWPVATMLAVQAVAAAPGAVRHEILAAALEPPGLLLDYMADEVVARESPAVLDLLRHAEPLRSLDSELAAAIGLGDVEQTVAEAGRRGVYLEPVPNRPGRVRLTPLFATFVRSRRPLDPVQRHDVLTRAMARHEESGELADALGYAAMLADVPACARLLTSHGADLISAGHARTVLDAIGRLRVRDGVHVAVIAGDPAMIETLAGDAWQLLGESTAALRCYERAVPGDGPTPAGLAWRIGLLYYLRGELGDAMKTYESGDRQDPNLTDRALMLGWAASAHWVRGDLDGCRSLAEQAYEAARSSGDDRALANAHTALAMVAALDGDRDANDAHYLKALDHAALAHDLLQLVRIHANRSSRHLEEGDPEGAVSEADVAIKLADLSGFAAYRALALSNRGQALLTLGRLDEARAELEAARAVYESLGAAMACYPSTWLGDLHSLRADRAAARASYERAITLAERVEDAQGLVPALSGLARLVAPEEPELAGELARRALRLGPSLSRVRALLAAATVAQRTGAGEQAMAYAEEAAELARTRRDRAGFAESYEILASLRGDAGLARSAIDLWRQLPSPLGTASASIVLAEMDDSPQGLAVAAQAAEQAGAIGARAIASRARALLLERRRTGVPEITIECLGGFRVLRAGEPVQTGEWQSRKARDVLRLLVSRRARPLHREQVLELLWPDEDPARTGNRLSVAASTVRTVLDPDRAHPADHYLRSDGDALRLDNVTTDIDRFLDGATVGLTLAREGELAAAREHLVAAELAYTGDLFEDDPYADWAVDLREKARLTYLEVARWLAGDAARAADREAQTRYLLRILERDPYDEPAHLDLVGLLAAAGRHGEARRRYRLYTMRMEEIDVEAAPYPTDRA